MDDKHSELLAILQKYGNTEFGTAIIDEVSELFGYCKTDE